MCCDIGQSDETCAHLVSSMVIRPMKDFRPLLGDEHPAQADFER